MNRIHRISSTFCNHLSDNQYMYAVGAVVLFSVVGIFFEFGPMSYQHFSVK